MTKPGPRVLAWDIETAPNLAYVWGLWQQNVGLNQIEARGDVLSFAARWVDEPPESIVFHAGRTESDHRKMVRAAHKLLDEADALVSWNGKSFDTKHMHREFLLAELTPPSPAREVDLMLVARKRFKFVSNKLENVSRELGLGGKVQHSGFELWRRCLQGDPAAWAEMQEYNEMDVHLLVDLYDRLLPWIDTAPNRNLFTLEEGCPRCPAGPEALKPRGFRLTNVGAFQRYRCQECGSWSSEGKRVHGVDIRPA
ncbi:ribonuclease H-like domain-containing protein [Amycolatopsis sp. NPDC004772]